MRTRRLLPVLLAAPLVAAGCSGDDDAAAPTAAPVTSTPSPSGPSSASPSPAATAGATATPAPAESDAPADGNAPFRADRSPDSSPGSGIGLSVVDVRVGQHEGYDRVVFELGGEGTVGWRVQYEDDPAFQGSGDPVDLAGDATLAVLLDGVGYPMDTGVPEYAGPRRFSPDLSMVREVQVGGVFEGAFDAFLGVAAERPFRAFRLEDPQRVVIDVAYGD